MTRILPAGLRGFAAAMFAASAIAAVPTLPSTAPEILQPVNGSTVSSPVTVIMRTSTDHGMADMQGMANMAQMPGMSAMGHGAHYHLLIDAPLPKPGTTVPMDTHHIHLVHGETKKILSLPPGRHTLQLILGSASHGVAANAAHSGIVTFEVK